MKNFDLQRTVLRLMGQLPKEHPDRHLLVTEDIQLPKKMKRYQQEEIRTYHQFEEYIREIFRLCAFLDDTESAFDLAYLQLAYLLPADELIKAGYLDLMYLEAGMNEFFYLRPDKLKEVMSEEAFEQLIADRHADAIIFEEVEDVNLLRATFSAAYERYNKTISNLLVEHGWSLVYTLADYLKWDVPIFTEFHYSGLSSQEHPLLAHLQEIYPDEEWTYQNSWSKLRKKMEELLFLVDGTQQGKFHWLYNLRLADGREYIDVPQEIKYERKKLEEAIRGGFTFKR